MIFVLVLVHLNKITVSFQSRKDYSYHFVSLFLFDIEIKFVKKGTPRVEEDGQ